MNNDLWKTILIWIGKLAATAAILFISLYAVTWEGNDNENVLRLLDWVLSPEGQYIIEQTGYTPIQ